MGLSPLAYKIEKQYSTFFQKKSQFLLGISGGLDSVVLFYLLLEIKAKYGFRLALVHIHHGENPDEKILEFRNRAQGFCQRLAAKHGIEILVEKAEITLVNSEEVLRNFRWSSFQRLKKEKEVLVLGQHEDDLFETRFLQLLRGAGVEGFKSMEFNARCFRPLLQVSKTDLVTYAKDKRISYVDDPSNGEDHYLRNWLRLYLFPKLEQKRPGSYTNMKRSFINIASALDREDLDIGPYLKQGALLRQQFMAQKEENKSQILVKYLHSIKHYRFSAGQIYEVLKRLDNLQKEYTFRTMRGLWVVSKKEIKFLSDTNE